MGQLERVPDPVDARAKLVRFSKKGRAALLDGLAILGELEDEMQQTLGEARMKALHATLAALVASDTTEPR